MKVFGDQGWLVFVLPGFIALFTAGFISDFPQIRDAQLPIIYIALTVLSVSVPFSCIHIYGRLKGKQYYIDSLIRSPSVVALIFLCSVILGFLFGIAHTTDYVSRGLRSVFGKDIILTSSHSELIKVLFKNSYNEKFFDGQPHISDDLKKFRNRYARFRFSKGRSTYEGVVSDFFGSVDKPQVYLSPACIIGPRGVRVVKGPGVWLNLDEVSDIQFIYSVCSECAMALEIAAGQAVHQLCPFK